MQITDMLETRREGLAVRLWSRAGRAGMALLICGMGWGALAAHAGDSASQEASKAFDRNLERTEACLSRVNWSPARDPKPHVEPGDGAGGCAAVKVPDATVQNWLGTVFIPNASLQDVEAVMQDYGNYVHIYPEVIDSRQLGRKGDEFDVALRLKKDLTLMSVVLNTAYHVRYMQPDARHLTVISRSTHIGEVKNPNASLTEERAPGDDLGLLWRLNAYWQLEAVDGGVSVRCQAISLSRDVPFGMGSVVKTFLDRFPKESMQATLESMQAAVAKRHGVAAPARALPRPGPVRYGE